MFTNRICLGGGNCCVGDAAPAPFKFAAGGALLVGDVALIPACAPQSDTFDVRIDQGTSSCARIVCLEGSGVRSREEALGEIGTKLRRRGKVWAKWICCWDESWRELAGQKLRTVEKCRVWTCRQEALICLLVSDH